MKNLYKPKSLKVIHLNLKNTQIISFFCIHLCALFKQKPLFFLRTFWYVSGLFFALYKDFGRFIEFHSVLIFPKNEKSDMYISYYRVYKKISLVKGEEKFCYAFKGKNFLVHRIKITSLNSS